MRLGPSRISGSQFIAVEARNMISFYVIHSIIEIKVTSSHRRVLPSWLNLQRGKPVLLAVPASMCHLYICMMIVIHGTFVHPEIKMFQGLLFQQNGIPAKLRL